MDGDGVAFAKAVRAELARRRVTRQWLADEARLSLSTLEKALSGQRSLTLATRLRVGAVLGLDEGGAVAEPQAGMPGAGVAPADLGAYSRAAVQSLQGDYLTLRPSFDSPGCIYAYRTEVRWDAGAGCLIFAERQRQDLAYAQQGRVSLPHQSGHVYLVTEKHGQYRLAILSRPTIDGALYGLLSTLQVSGAQLIPASVPLALLPIEGALGAVRPGDPCFDLYAGHLSRIRTGGFANFPD